MPTSFICCKTRLVTRDFSFLCLQNIYITMVVTTNEIIAVTERKMSTVGLLKKKFFLSNLNHYYYAFLANQKLPFYVKTGEQSLLVFGPFINSELKSNYFKEIGKVCS